MKKKNRTLLDLETKYLPRRVEINSLHQYLPLDPSTHYQN
jgi:hypothetical protein